MFIPDTGVKRGHSLACRHEIASLSDVLHAIELKLPPVFQVLLAAGALVAMPGGVQAFPGQRVLAVALFAVSVVCAVPAVVAFVRARTTVHPMAPGEATTLVTDGVYSFTRNPMYLGMAIALVSLAIWLGQVWNGTLIVGAFVALMTRLQIIPEERALEVVFGAEYLAYRKHVRRWV